MNIRMLLILAITAFMFSCTAEAQNKTNMLQPFNQSDTIVFEKIKTLDKIYKRINERNNSLPSSSGFGTKTKECEEQTDSEKRNICLKELLDEFKVALNGLWHDDITNDPFPTADNSLDCKKIRDKKLFLSSKSYAVYSDKQDTKYLVAPMWTPRDSTTEEMYQFILDKNEPFNSSLISTLVEEKFDKQANEDFDSPAHKIDVYDWPSGGRVKLFMFNNDVYLYYDSYNSNLYHIFKLDKKSLVFDRACKIERIVTNYNTEPQKVCEAVKSGNYSNPKPIDVNKTTTDDIYKLLRNGHFLGSDGSFDGLFFIDYLNDGKKRYLIFTYYFLYRTFCSISYYLAYDPQAKIPIQEITKKEENGCSTEERLAIVDNKVYSILEQNGELISVRQYIDQNGTVSAQTICDFKPLYQYK